MKKLLAIMAVAISTSAVAGDKIELGYRYDDKQNSSADSRNVTIGWNTDINKNFTWGLDANLAQRTTDDRVTNRLATSLTGSYNMFYVSAKVGEKFQSGSDSTSFWVVEPGVKFKLSENLGAKVGYSYRQAFSKTVDDDLKGVRLALDYKLTKEYGIGLKYDLMEDSAGIKTDRYGITISKRF